MRYKYVFGYLRLSIDDDKIDESNSIRNQKLLIEQFIAEIEDFQNAKVQFFSDDGFSGTNFERPAFKRMMEIAKGKDSCCIIVKDLSRLGRDTLNTQDYIEKVFPFMQIRFIAINDYYDSIDTHSSKKDTEVKFKNLVNGIYPQICSKNVKAVMRRRAEQGKYNGSVPPYGMRINEEDQSSLLVDREVSWVVRLIIDEKLAGKRYVDIARLLNEKKIQTPTQYLISKEYSIPTGNVGTMWTTDMVKKIATNPVYTGAIVNHKSENAVVAVKSPISIPREEWIIVPGMHEAIMTMEELDTILGMIKHSKKIRKQHVNRSKFRGKLRCGYCKRIMRVRTEDKFKNKKISCYTPKQISDAKCYKGLYLVEDLEKLLIELIRHEALIADDTIKKMKEINKTTNISRWKKQLEGYEAKLQKNKLEKMGLYEKYASQELSKAKYIAEKKKVSDRDSVYLKKICDVKAKIKEAEEKKRKVADSKLHSLSKYKQLEELTYEIVQELVDTIYFYDPEHIEVIWNFRDEYVEATE